VIEMLTFRLAAAADEDAFRRADRRVQVEFAYLQPGMMRRTTARSEDGEWIVLDLWQSADAADACNELREKHPVTQEFMGFVDASSVRTRRYFELD
jgi:hypothetical protein